MERKALSNLYMLITTLEKENLIRHLEEASKSLSMVVSRLATLKMVLLLLALTSASTQVVSSL